MPKVGQSEYLNLTKYRVYCTTDNKFVETDYREQLPTVCPENNTHSISTIQEIDIIGETWYSEVYKNLGRY